MQRLYIEPQKPAGFDFAAALAQGEFAAIGEALLFEANYAQSPVALETTILFLLNKAPESLANYCVLSAAVLVRRFGSISESLLRAIQSLKIHSELSGALKDFEDDCAMFLRVDKA